MSRSLWVLNLHTCCDICQYQVLFSIRRTRKKRPETGKLILADTGCFPRVYKRSDTYSRTGINVRETLIWWAWLFPTSSPSHVADVADVEMWQVVGRSGNLRDLLEYQKSRKVTGKIKTWRVKEQNINLLKLSFLVHCSWNSLFYTHDWIRWCTQGFHSARSFLKYQGWAENISSSWISPSHQSLLYSPKD